MSKRIFVPDLIRKRQRGEAITMLTAYDFTFASLVDQAGVDVILVGDSLGTVVQGHETTIPVTVDQMVYHVSLVARAAKSALVVADLPFMSYQPGPEVALQNAGRFIKEAGAAAVKLEGGQTVSETIRRIVDAGIPVMGHVGLTPQSFHTMGGHKIQGKRSADAKRLLADAKAVENAGAFCVVLEGIPASLAEQITNNLSIPTIGIGAGSKCSGQVLVLHDLLGITPLGEGAPPKFVKQYANLKETILSAVANFITDVKSGEFPTTEHEYKASPEKSGPRRVVS